MKSQITIQREVLLVRVLLMPDDI